MTMGTTERLPKVRSTLRHILKEVLRCRAWPASASEAVRRVSLAPPRLPQLSQVSLFPDFESDRFGIDRYSVSSVGTAVSLYSHLNSACSESRSSLLPATRLSQVNPSDRYANNAALARREVRYECLPETLMEGASQHASILSPKFEPSLRSRSSTLKIRRSMQFASSEGQSTLARGASLPPMLNLRKARGSEEVRRNSSTTSFASRSASQIDTGILDTLTPKYNSDHSSRSNAFIHSVKHFVSFCVLDTSVSGCPVTATSDDLRYLFQIGEHFMLNIQECEGTSIDIVIGFSPDGDEVIHLVLFSPLLSPSTGKSRFVLAALIEVTHFAHEVSQLPELDSVAEESYSGEEIATPVATPPQSTWSTRSCELRPDDLLGGCSVTAKPKQIPVTEVSSISQSHQSRPTAFNREPEDVWLALAREEQVERDRQRRAGSMTENSPGYDAQQSLRSDSTGSSSSSTAVDKVLDEFMSSLQEIYSDSFLLARSPLDDKFYEICNVSPAVYASGEYVTGHLTHTASDVIEGMGERLGAGSPFRAIVRWGSQGVEKRLYCVPLFGQSSLTWICVLVDFHMPVLW